jgi:hypothetical protein
MDRIDFSHRIERFAAGRFTSRTGADPSGMAAGLRACNWARGHELFEHLIR